MHVHVDQSGTNDLARGIERAIGLRRRVRPHGENVFAANPQIANAVEILRRVDDPAIGNAEGVHGGDCMGME